MPHSVCRSLMHQAMGQSQDMSITVVILTASWKRYFFVVVCLTLLVLPIHHPAKHCYSDLNICNLRFAALEVRITGICLLLLIQQYR